MPESYAITTDYRTNATWNLRDPDRTSVKIATVGTLAQEGSNMGHQVSIQKDAMNQLIDEVEAVRDVIRSLSVQGFAEMRISDVGISPPESVDIPDLIGKPISSLDISAIDRLVGLADWIKTNFTQWVGPASPLLDFDDVKVTFRKTSDNSDAWLALKDIYPLPVIPVGGVPRAEDDTVLLNRPFSVENDSAVYMMIAGDSGNPEQVKITSIKEMFFLDTVLADFGSATGYFAQLTQARTDALVAILPEGALPSVPFDVIATRSLTSSDESFSQFVPLPMVDTTIVIPTAGTSFGPIQAPAGSLIRSPIASGSQEYRYYVATNDNPSGPVDLREVLIDPGKKYILGLSDSERQTIISQLGDTVVTLTQKSSQQSLYLNELMQKMALLYDSASNALKAMTDNENRIAAAL